MGARVVPVFGANCKVGVEDVGNRLQRALDQIDPYNMYLIFSFTDVHKDVELYLKADKHFYKCQDKYLDHEWYEHGYKDNYLPFVEYIVKRFKDHPRIFAWELGNELKARNENQIWPNLGVVSKRG